MHLLIKLYVYVCIYIYNNNKKFSGMGADKRSRKGSKPS